MTRVCLFAFTVLFLACQPTGPADEAVPETLDAGVEPAPSDGGTLDAQAPTLEGALNLWLTGADSPDPVAAGQTRELFIEVSGLLRSSQGSARFMVETQVEPGFGVVSPVDDVTFSGLDALPGTARPVSTTQRVQLTVSGAAQAGTVRVNVRPAQGGCEAGFCLTLEIPVSLGQGLGARALGAFAPRVARRDQVERPQGVSILVPLRNGSAQRTWVVSASAPADWAAEGEELLIGPGESAAAFLRVRWTGQGSPTANVTHSIRVEARSGAVTESASALLTVTP